MREQTVQTKVFTNVKIKGTITNDRNTGYYVKIHYMYGDADGYKDIEYGPFTEDKVVYLLAFVNMLEECLSAYPNGRGGCDNYEDKVKGFAVWSLMDDIEDTEKCNYTIDGHKLTEDDINEIENIGFDVEYFPGWDDIEASIEYYTVEYYDSNTRQSFEVELS